MLSPPLLHSGLSYKNASLCRAVLHSACQNCNYPKLYILTELKKTTRTSTSRTSQQFTRKYAAHYCEFYFNSLILYRILKQELLVPKAEYSEPLVQETLIYINSELPVLIRFKSELPVPGFINIMISNNYQSHPSSGHHNGQIRFLLPELQIPVEFVLFLLIV